MKNYLYIISVILIIIFTCVFCTFSYKNIYEHEKQQIMDLYNKPQTDISSLEKDDFDYADSNMVIDSLADEQNINSKFIGQNKNNNTVNNQNIIDSIYMIKQNGLYIELISCNTSEVIYSVEYNSFNLNDKDKSMLSEGIYTKSAEEAFLLLESFSN